GDSLALGRMVVSAGGTATENFDVGAFNAEEIQLLEVDVHGRLLRFEIFAENRLGDAVARLYERYADLLPDGPERARAAATARSVATLLGPHVPERWEAALASDVEYVDHRTLGLGSSRGAQRFLQGLRLLLEVAGDVTGHVDDILGLQPDALLVRRTHSGTVRASGGAYEQLYCWLVVFGTDGLLTRAELFDADREAEALARFDELAGERAVGRRVRPNAAIANIRSIEAAVAARDADALATLLASDAITVDHKVGAEFDREESLRLWFS